MSSRLPQQSLTRTPPPQLDWQRAEAPASRAYDDIYFSVDGGLAETQAVFLDGCGLKTAWAALATQTGPAVFTIGELGFGSGLNFLAALQLWQSCGLSSDPSKRLHFISIEAMPWSQEDLQRGLVLFPSLAPLAEEMIAAWPGPVKGLHRIHFGNAALTLMHMEAAQALPVMDAQVDAWFLDGFSPSKNPDMWSGDVFGQLAARSHKGTRLATFSVAGHVRRGLERVGFETRKMPGFGRKRHRLEATFQGGASTASIQTMRPPVIIGGGIAGASIARAYLRRGMKPTLIENEQGLETAASSNPAAMVMPRLDLQDRPESRFFLSAYIYAQAQYGAGSGLLSQGAVQLAQSDAEAKRFQKLAANQPLLDKQMYWQGEPAALVFPKACVIDPMQVITDWTQGCQRISENAQRIIEGVNGWEVETESGTKIQADHIHICAGADVLALDGIDGIAPVRFTRGQVSWGPHGGNGSPQAMVFGGYAVPMGDTLLLGATHEHVGPGAKTELSAADESQNRSRYEARFEQILPEHGWQSRAAVRVTTKDTLPVSQCIGDRVYVLSGLGARGFMMAPLLGEAQVCSALGEPSPLCQNTKMRFEEREVS